MGSCPPAVSGWSSISQVWLCWSSFTCFTPLWNSAEFRSNSKKSSTRYMVNLHRNHVIGSGMPTTEIAGWPSELPGGCEPNSLWFWPANTTLRRHNLRPWAACSAVKGRAGRTHTPAHRRWAAGSLPQVGPFFQGQSPDVHAARPPSSRHAARLPMRCITAGRTPRYRRREIHGPGLDQTPLTLLPLVTLCNSPHAVPIILIALTTYTRGCCLQVQLEMSE